MASLVAAPPYAVVRAQARPRLLSDWLFAVAGLVFLMVVVGGITRLTESGLSITRWDPVTGAIPPLTRADWEETFALYRQSSQYRLQTFGMSLAEFQFIYFWEWLHRLLGRLIGVAFALPFALFAWRRWVPAGYGLRLLALLALGGLQGAIGWWMVKSGLVDRVDVAHERLAVHLLTAFTILGGLVWTALDLRATAAAGSGRLRVSVARGDVDRPRRWVLPLLALLFVQSLFGAFTAGLHAGQLYPTWPLMAGSIAPPELGALAPLWRDLIDNPATVQFVHRTLAMAVAGVALWVSCRCAKAGAGWRALALAGAVSLQFALGVLTLVHQVPLVLGVMHQAGAAVLLTMTVVLAHWATRPMLDRDLRLC